MFSQLTRYRQALQPRWTNTMYFTTMCKCDSGCPYWKHGPAKIQGGGGIQSTVSERTTTITSGSPTSINDPSATSNGPSIENTRTGNSYALITILISHQKHIIYQPYITNKIRHDISFRQSNTQTTGIKGRRRLDPFPPSSLLSLETAVTPKFILSFWYFKSL